MKPKDYHCNICNLKLFDGETQKQLWPEIRVVKNDPGSAVCVSCSRTITLEFIKINKIRKPTFENN
jgi:hypothetical protein